MTKKVKTKKSKLIRFDPKLVKESVQKVIEKTKSFSDFIRRWTARSRRSQIPLDL